MPERMQSMVFFPMIFPGVSRLIWGSWAVRLRLSFHPIVMLAAALRFAFCLLRLLLAQKKKEQPEEQKKQTA